MGKLKELLGPFKVFWNPPREVLLVRTLVVGSLCTILLMIITTIVVFKPRHAPPVEGEVAAEVEAEEKPEAAEKSEKGGEGEHKNEIVLNQNPIPKSIRERRTGHMLPDHDLVDPDIHTARDLASAMKEDLKVKSPYRRFVELPQIMAATQAKDGFSRKVMATTFLEVDTAEAEREVKERKLEFQSLVSSLMSEKKGDSLKTPEGVADLKEQAQRELNHLMKDGQVVDVLFSEFFVL